LLQCADERDREDAANAQSGSGEQNPAQVHVPNEAKLVHPSATNTIQDIEGGFMEQQ